MKKIFTLILATGLITTAAFSQDRRHSFDNRRDENSYQNQSPANNGYGYTNPYGSNWNSGRNEEQSGYDRHDWDQDGRMMYHHRHHRRYYDDYRNRRGLSFRVIIGSRTGY
jgi:hypothetical protein